MTRRRRPRQLWERGGGIPGSLAGQPLPPEAFSESGGRRIPQRRHARNARVGGRRMPVWIVPVTFAFVLLALIITIILTA
jgi:uncharacterized membrane protein YdfJ with MMPL/SSD domain